MTQPEHFPNNNASDFQGNGIQHEFHTQQPVSDFGSETSEIYDPSGDRRKRRKVSVEPENHLFESKQWNLLPPPRILGKRRPDVGKEAHLDSTLVDVPSPKKKRGRPPKASLAKGNNQENVRDAVASNVADLSGAEATVNESPKETGSGRKKSMRLTAKGTLLSSPSSSQESRQKHKAVTPKGPVRKNPSNLTLKNGKFIQTLTVRLKYQDAVIGKRIDEILAADQVLNSAKTTSDTGRVVETTGKTTHPFFLGKVSARPQAPATDESDTKAQESHDEGKKAVPWKDIVFKTRKPTFSKALQKPAWPPHAYQHVGRLTLDKREYEHYTARKDKKKAKQIANEVGQSENILARYTNTLLHNEDSKKGCRPCERVVCTSEEVLHLLGLNEDILTQYPPVKYARETALAGSSPFDRGSAPGPLPWSQKYGPSKWQEVLQPDCQQLYEWLKGLAIHQVQSGADKGGSKPIAKRKKKPKKRDDELSDFIVNDFDDQEPSKIKNAILLIGPNGCGKTASVFAIAKQLGFEVFEIHSGTRRSQKDIFDKVGDMAKNHLVQGGPIPTRDPSVLPEVESTQDSNDPAQQSINTLFSKPTTKLVKSSRSATPQPTKEQKQSLILLEEVDHIFEDDRGFWSGVQALIENSKRPVIMTCNTLQGIPLDELDLFTILSYSQPPADAVGEYLSYIAVAEGHIIEPGVIRKLYVTKHYDLRATMMELDLWCQMTIGSDKGGLDWFPQYNPSVSTGARKPRVFSRNTFMEGLDLLPLPYTNLSESLRFLNHSSDIPLSKCLEHGSTARARLQSTTLLEMTTIAMNCSDVDLLDQPTQAFVAASMWPKEEEDLQSLRRFARTYHDDPANKEDEPVNAPFEILHPLASERPIFPPSQGRLAPSLDEPRKVIATDLAPYVRSIAVYDLGLEAYRDELSSSQGKKVRTTRAARAAAEGGDKGSTRPERWLPAELDLRAVLETGGNWPRWSVDAAGSQAAPPASDQGPCNQFMPDYVHHPGLVTTLS